MYKNNSSNLFLLELIFSIFFFIVVSTICLQIFSKSHSLNETTKQLNDAIFIAQNEIEAFYSDPFSEDIVTSYISYEDYCIARSYTIDNSFKYFSIRITDSKSSKEIYSIMVKVALPNGGQ